MPTALCKLRGGSAGVDDEPVSKRLVGLGVGGGGERDFILLIFL